MRFLALALTLLALCTVGCAVQVDAPAPAPETPAAPVVLGTAYALVLDASLTSDQATAVLAAADEWSGAAPGLVFAPTYGTCSAAALHTICVRAVQNSMLKEIGSGVTGVTYEHPELDGALIEVSGLANLTWITAHELGHAMGLQHTKEIAALMYPDMQLATNSPTCLDVASFWGARGTKGPCEAPIAHLGF